MSIRVAIVEDNDSIRESLALILDGSPGLQCCGAWRTAEEALANLPRLAASCKKSIGDRADLATPGTGGLAAAK